MAHPFRGLAGHQNTISRLHNDMRRRAGGSRGYGYSQIRSTFPMRCAPPGRRLPRILLVFFSYFAQQGGLRLALGSLAIVFGLLNLGGCAGGFAGFTPTATKVVTQPVSQTVGAGQPATFSVSATGTGPMTYQWYKNGVAISGATSS